MAILQMERIRLCAMRRDRKKILEFLQRQGVVEIYDAGGGPDDPVFKKQDTATATTLLDKNKESSERAVEILDKYVPHKAPSLAFLRGREAISVEDNLSFASKREKVLASVHDVIGADREIHEARADVLRIEAQMEALKPWLSLPISQMSTGTKRTAIFIGQFECLITEGEILEKLAVAEPELDKIHIETVFVSDELTCVYVITPKADRQKAEQALRNIGFMRPATLTHRVPADKQKRLEEQLAQAKAEIKKQEDEIISHGGERTDFLMLRDDCAMRSEKYGVIEQLALSRHTFALDGFIAQPDSQRVARALEEKFTCAVNIWSTESPDMPGDLEVPVMLKNNRFAEPVETVLESYSMPSKGEIDPTPVMCIFYYVMFGLMFSDAAYGLIMVIVTGAALLMFKNMEQNWKKNIKLFFWCGVSTTFWGVMFSSYFGNLISAVSGTFFGNEIVIKPVWLDPIQQPMMLLVFSLGLGILHLSAGMALNAITHFKNKRYIDIVYDVAFPLMIVYPLVVLLMASPIFLGMAGFMLELPSNASTVLLSIAAVGVVGVVLTGGRESKTWGKRSLKGLYALYNTLSGWLGDILSYSRLLALGLATGVIAMVMNTLASMPAQGNKIVGAFFFIIVFFLGHGLNFGINVLGAYVHSNRLEFVEFFGKFYEGGGRKFKPFGIHTKHYKIIEEETQNG